MGKYTVEKLKPTMIGVFHNVSYAYSDYLSKRFIEAVEKETASLPSEKKPTILVQKVLSRSEDFSEQIEFFKAHKVTHLVMLTVDSDFMRFATQAERSQFFPVYIGSDGWGTNLYVHKRYVTEAPSGEKFVAFRDSYWKEDAESSMANLFREEFFKKNRQKPNAWNAIAFDAAWVLFTAMSKAKNPKSGAEIQAQLSKIRGLPIVTAKELSFGPDNSPKKDLYVYKISKDGIQYQATLQ